MPDGRITVSDVLYTFFASVYILVMVTATAFLAGLILTIAVSAFTQDSKSARNKNEQDTTIVVDQVIFK